eukprot:800761-Rhodomonas_salina.1
MDSVLALTRSTVDLVHFVRVRGALQGGHGCPHARPSHQALLLLMRRPEFAIQGSGSAAWNVGRDFRVPTRQPVQAS